MTLMPIVARQLFTDDAQGLGYLTAGVGAGALFGALLLSARTPRQRKAIPIAVGMALIFGIALTSTGAFRSIRMVSILFFACGASMVMSLALCNATIQQRIPDVMRGRVLSMYTYAFYAFVPFGNLFAGILAERRGISQALAGLGGGLMLCASIAGVALITLRSPESPRPSSGGM
jgi:predicted MFS family arabinose efflux permease